MIDLSALVMTLNDEYWLPYALESTRGYFNRYVIYDMGSTDRTSEVIDWFTRSNSSVSFFTRRFNTIPPRDIQGALRNAMIAESQSEYFFILDGDEVYSPYSLNRLTYEWDHYKESSKLYGVIRRIEFSNDLTKRYNTIRSHHRVYHRTAVFDGPHPGERNLIPQNGNEYHFKESTLCYHFHNAIRSSKENEALKRAERKSQHTYHPGTLESFDLLKALPILSKPILDFPVAPELKKLQNEHNLGL